VFLYILQVKPPFPLPGFPKYLIQAKWGMFSSILPKGALPNFQPSVNALFEQETIHLQKGEDHRLKYKETIY